MTRRVKRREPADAPALAFRALIFAAYIMLPARVLLIIMPDIHQAYKIAFAVFSWIWLAAWIAFAALVYVKRSAKYARAAMLLWGAELLLLLLLKASAQLTGDTLVTLLTQLPDEAMRAAGAAVTICALIAAAPVLTLPEPGGDILATSLVFSAVLLAPFLIYTVADRIKKRVSDTSKDRL